MNRIRLFLACVSRHPSWLRRSHSGASSEVTQAWQAYEYGSPDVLVLSTSLKVPAIRTPFDILVKVHASSVNPLDVMMLGRYGATIMHYWRGLYELSFTPQEFPLTLGRDFSGTIVGTGSLVKNLKVGDEVYGIVGPQRPGSHASYVTTPAAYVSKKPLTLSHVEAASLPYASLTAWSAISTFGGLSADSTYGKKVAVFGGSGGVGTIAIQLLRSWGATITATCATDAVDMVQGLGVDNVVDYLQQEVRLELQSSGKFDFILDTVNGKAYEQCLDLLKRWKNCKYVTTVSPLLKNADQFGIIPGTLKSLLEAATDTLVSFKDGRSYRWAYVIPNCWALKKIAEMADKKQILPIIDKVYKFEEIPDAYRKMLAGHARGKLVIDHLSTAEDVEESEPGSASEQQAAQQV